MIEKTRDFYIGIDLGTTNSSIAWGSIGAKGIFNPRMVDMQLPMSDGSWETRQLLPSFVYIPKENREPEVGYIAKQMLKTHPERVIRSIKTKMGSNWKKSIDGVEYTPSKVSSLILKQLQYNIKKTFRVPVNDIVITVPASFDSEMRSSTLEAAREAGIKVKNKDGTPRNILLDEPRACLYDFVNRQKQGEIPDHIIDFSSKKIILVYDLGGGTLDVSLHSVNFNKPDDLLVNIEDIAISRYTDIGGDNFDEKLAEILFEGYLKEYKLRIDDFPEYEIDYAKTILFYFAESFKLMITNDALIREEMCEEYEPEDLIRPIMPGYLLEQKPLSLELSLKEYEELMSEFLAKDLEYPIKSNIGKHIGERNLISPILDVLYKAYNKTNQIIKPDLILLSGGMTKLPMIRNRLADFFGMTPLTIPDPDKAVSRGAAIYHYYLHQGYQPTAILAESIFMKGRDHKTQKEKLIELIPAGVPLPYEYETNLMTEGKKKDIGINLYRTDENHHLAKRKFTLSKQYPPKTKVHVKVSVDLLKVLDFKAWIKEDPSEKIAISVDINGTPKKSKLEKRKEQEEIKIAEQEMEEKRQKIEEQLKKSGIVTHMQLSDFFKPIPSTGTPNYSILTERDIISAENIENVIRSLLKLQKKTHPKIREKIILLLGDIVSNSSIQMKYEKSIKDVLKSMISYVNMIQNLPNPNPKEINLNVRYAIETIGKTKTIDIQRNVIKTLIDWVNEPIFRKIRNALLTSMGKMPPDNELIEFLVKFVSKPQQKNTLIPSLWALGKQGSRDLAHPVLIDYLGSIHENIMEILDKTEDFEIIQYISYALLELCKLNPDQPENCCADEIREEVIYNLKNKLEDLETPFKNQKFTHLDKKLKDWGRFLTTQTWINLAIQSLKGLKIKEEELELLDEFRNR